MCEGEFVGFLLTFTRENDVSALQNQLLTVTNPVDYLNRLYDEVNMQKCTLIATACLKGHVDVIRMLLTRFTFDLEVLNDVILSDGNPNQRLFANVSVLWIATSINHFEIVKLLVEHGADINHTTKTNSTPLRGACYNGNVDMARYLVEQGADVHMTKENNDTNLMVSVCHKHIHMIIYLVRELNCDVNICDNDGRSALYDAVNSGSLEVVEFLLKSGARNFRAIKDQFSPLMWAAEKRRTDLMEAIGCYCTLVERIEAEELIASSFVCGPQGERNLDQAGKYFHHALELRLAHNLPKSSRSISDDIFQNQEECQTIDELLSIQLNFHRMYIESLLVRERLLGSTNEEYRYSLCYRGAMFADSGQHHEGVEYWIYELNLCQQYKIPLDAKHLRRFASLFSGMLYKKKSIPMDALYTIFVANTNELHPNSKNFDYNLYTLLFLITIISQIFTKNDLSATDSKRFHRHLYSINQRNYTLPESKRSLLHLSLDSQTMVEDYHIKRICKYPCLSTARILLQCGAAVNARDAQHNTPMHIIASNRSACDLSVLNLFDRARAHFDYANASGQTPADLATNRCVHQWLKCQMNLCLKCLCARLIRRQNIPFTNIIARSLASFVEKH